MLIPYYQSRVKSDHYKEVVEKVLECIKDLVNEAGPASVEGHMEWITASLEQLLDNKALC